MQYSYQTQGVCAKEMRFTVEGGLVTRLSFQGGCSGNLLGISRLVEGMPVEEVIARLEGVRCAGRASSCPDQLALALREVMGQEEIR